MLTDYIRTDLTTVELLRDWRNQELALQDVGARLEEIDTRLTGTTGRMGATPVMGGGGNRVEAALVDGIARKDVIERGAKKAEEYFAALLPKWARLSGEEQWLLTVRYVDGDGTNWLPLVKERLHIEEREAYRRTRDALRKLARILWW